MFFKRIASKVVDKFERDLRVTRREAREKAKFALLSLLALAATLILTVILFPRTSQTAKIETLLAGNLVVVDSMNTESVDVETGDSQQFLAKAGGQPIFVRFNSRNIGYLTKIDGTSLLYQREVEHLPFWFDVKSGRIEGGQAVLSLGRKGEVWGVFIVVPCLVGLIALLMLNSSITTRYRILRLWPSQHKPKAAQA